jgi:hypothetical protein
MRGNLFMSAAIGALAAFGFVSVASAQGADQAGDATTTARLTVGQSVSGTLGAAGDKDWFRLSVEPGQMYRIALDGAGDAALGDPMVVVYGANGQELARNDDGPAGLNSLLIYRPSQAGEVFVEARGFTDEATGGYTLSAAATAIPPDNAGNDAATATPFTLSQSVDAALEYPGDTDWYRLSVEPGNVYRIALDSAGESDALGDPLLVLYSVDNSELARNDDSSGSLNSRLRYTPTESGEVLVEARGLGDDAVGSYQLRIEGGPLPPDNAGNDSTTTSRLTAGQTLSGAVDYPSDVDWFRVAVRPGRIYHFTLDGVGPEGAALDPNLVLYNSEGEEIARNDDAEGTLNSRLDYVANERGEIFVEAGAFSEDAEGAYQLRVEEARLPADDAGNSSSTRGRIAVGESVTGTLDYTSDTDWFRITLADGESYRFSLNSGDGANALGDPMLRLLDAEGEELVSDDDGGGGLNSYIEYTAPAAGNYFLEARAFVPEGVGGYVLTAAAGDIPADNTTDATLSADGDYREGMLAPAGDSDWYRIDLAEGQTIRIGLDSSSSATPPLGDPLLVLHGPDGAEIARDDDGGDGLNSWIEFAAETAGAYFIEARGFMEESEGGYAISVTAGEIPGSVEGAEYLMPNGDGRTSIIGAPDDADWFAIELVEGRPYRFNLESGATDPLTDPMLALYDAEGNQVAADDDGGTGYNSYLSYSSITGGTHYAAVSAFEGTAGGSYLLRVTDTDVPGNIGTDENLNATESDDRNSRIDMTGDLDVYRVELTAGVSYLITLSGEGDTPLTDPFLTITSSSGEAVTTDDDSGEGLDAQLRFTPETTDVFHIQASGLGNSVGGYNVSIARQ